MSTTILRYCLEKKTQAAIKKSALPELPEHDKPIKRYCIYLIGAFLSLYIEL